MLFLFVHELFLLKFLSEEMSNFSYPVLAGRILNRFAKDIGHMDELLPLIFLDFIQVTLTVLSEFSQGGTECLFLKDFSQGLRVGLSAWQCVLLSSVNAVFVRKRCSSDWEGELT